MTAEANMNREHFEYEKSIRLNVTNETLEENPGKMGTSKRGRIRSEGRGAGSNRTGTFECMAG